jgi:predicted dehydrogenase
VSDWARQRLRRDQAANRNAAERLLCYALLLPANGGCVVVTVVGVGIIGLSAAGGWAASAHVPALSALDAFELRGAAASSADSAAAAGRRYAVPLTFTSARELAEHDEIDLVVVAVKVTQHLELVRTALEAGKMVYCEWPLGRNLAEAGQLAQLAAHHGSRTVIGLQAQSAPAFRYLQDLIADGYAGQVLSTSVIASGLNWGATFRPGSDYMLERGNGATLLSIPFAHTVDVLEMVLGEFTELKAVLGHRRTHAMHAETGEIRPMDAEDQVAVIGTLEGGAVASLHFRGGLSRGTNFLWEINGTDGDLIVSLDFAHPQFGPVSLRGARGADTVMSELPIPERYRQVPGLAEHQMAYNVAHAYARLGRDLQDGRTSVPGFAHGLTRHNLLDRIASSATSGQGDGPDVSGLVERGS